jgi:hypothetical protein
MCSEKSDSKLRACPGCALHVCHACACITSELLGAVEPFLKASPCAAWAKLQCLKCQSVDDYDSSLPEGAAIACLQIAAGIVALIALAAVLL